MADETNNINQVSSASSSTSVNKWQELANQSQQDAFNQLEADKRRQDAIDNLDSPNFTKDPAVDQQNQWRKEDREQAQSDYEQNRKDALEDYERQKQDSREDYDYKFDKENDITALRKRYEDAGFSAAAAIGAGVSSPVSGAPDTEPSPLDSVPSTSQVSETSRDPSTFEKVMNGLSTLSSLVSTATDVAGLAVDAGVKAATKTSINLANTLAQETIKNEIIASYIMNLKGYAEINAIYHTIDRDNTALDIDAMRLNLDYLAQDLNERRFLFEQESTSRSLDQGDRRLDLLQQKLGLSREQWEILKPYVGTKDAPWWLGPTLPSKVESFIDAFKDAFPHGGSKQSSEKTIDRLINKYFGSEDEFYNYFIGVYP